MKTKKPNYLKSKKGVKEHEKIYIYIDLRYINPYFYRLRQQRARLNPKQQRR